MLVFPLPHKNKQAVGSALTVVLRCSTNFGCVACAAVSRPRVSRRLILLLPKSHHSRGYPASIRICFTMTYHTCTAIYQLIIFPCLRALCTVTPRHWLRIIQFHVFFSRFSKKPRGYPIILGILHGQPVVLGTIYQSSRYLAVRGFLCPIGTRVEFHLIVGRRGSTSHVQGPWDQTSTGDRAVDISDK